MTIPDKPLSRKEQYLSKMAGDDQGTPDRPLSREEEYLDTIAKSGGGKAVKYVQLELTGATAGGYSVSIEYTTAELAAFQEDGYLLALRMSVPSGAGFPEGDYTLMVENVSSDLMIAAGVIGAEGINQVFTVYQTSQTQNTGILFVINFNQSITAFSNPTSSNAGGHGAIWVNASTKDFYICTGDINGQYTWKKIMTE